MSFLSDCFKNLFLLLFGILQCHSDCLGVGFFFFLLMFYSDFLNLNSQLYAFLILSVSQFILFYISVIAVRHNIFSLCFLASYLYFTHFCLCSFWVRLTGIHYFSAVCNLLFNLPLNF